MVGEGFWKVVNLDVVIIFFNVLMLFFKIFFWVEFEFKIKCVWIMVWDLE